MEVVKRGEDFLAGVCHGHMHLVDANATVFKIPYLIFSYLVGTIIVILNPS